MPIRTDTGSSKTRSIEEGKSGTHANTMPMTIASISSATMICTASSHAAAQHCCGPVLP